tara:strand:+ start:158 stop:664 length:507 start_codon:yes stop_codon:yes gene_type:complete
MGSSYFDTSSYLNKETNKSPFTLGNNSDLFDFSKFKNKENENKLEIKVGEEDKGKSFLDKQLGNYKAYLEATKENKSEEDKDRELLRELANKQSMQFGDMAKGFSTEVAQGLNIYQPSSPNQQMFIPGEKGGKSLGQRFAGGIAGLGKGLMTGTPHGGAFGFASGFFG